MIESFSNPKYSPLGPQKVKNDPKIKSKINVGFERNKEKEICSTTWVDPKTVAEPCPKPKNSQVGSKNSKMTPKLSQNQMSEFKVTK